MEKEEVQAPNSVNSFKAYPSIQNHYRDKFVQGITDLGYDNQTILWVVSEKIHGSNFSAHCFGEYAKYGRRTDFITDEVPIPCKPEQIGAHFKESFYDARNLVQKFHNGLGQVWNRLKKDFPDMVKFSLFGEYFGGNWPETHPNYVKGAKHVQKGIFYTPQHEFMAFDIYVSDKEKSFWVDVTDLPKYLGQQVKTIPIFAKGTFKEVFDIDIKIDSTIPELLGLPKLKNNLIQGMVIRPNHSLKDKYQERVILKKKNAEFSEISTGKQTKEKKEKVEKELDPQLAKYVQSLDKYVNENRVESVVSKFPDLKDRNKLKAQIVKDIMTDAEKDGYKAPEAAELQKKVDLELNKRIMKAVGQYYKKK